MRLKNRVYSIPPEGVTPFECSENHLIKSQNSKTKSNSQTQHQWTHITVLEHHWHDVTLVAKGHEKPENKHCNLGELIWYDPSLAD